MILQLSQNAIRILEARYLRRDAKRRLLETPEQFFDRVLTAVAHAETLLGNTREAPSWKKQFYDMLSSLDFLPSSPTLMNAGTPWGSSVPALYSLWRTQSRESLKPSSKRPLLAVQEAGLTFPFQGFGPKAIFWPPRVVRPQDQSPS